MVELGRTVFFGAIGVAFVLLIGMFILIAIGYIVRGTLDALEGLQLWLKSLWARRSGFFPAAARGAIILARTPFAIVIIPLIAWHRSKAKGYSVASTVSEMASALSLGLILSCISLLTVAVFVQVLWKQIANLAN